MMVVAVVIVVVVVTVVVVVSIVSRGLSYHTIETNLIVKKNVSSYSLYLIFTLTLYTCPLKYKNNITIPTFTWSSLHHPLLTFFSRSSHVHSLRSSSSPPLIPLLSFLSPCFLISLPPHSPLPFPLFSPPISLMLPFFLFLPRPSYPYLFPCSWSTPPPPQPPPPPASLTCFPPSGRQPGNVIVSRKIGSNESSFRPTFLLSYSSLVSISLSFY